MEYRIAVRLVNDDDDPATESIAHVIGHLLRGEGIVGLTVVAVPESGDPVVPEDSKDVLQSLDGGSGSAATDRLQA